MPGLVIIFYHFTFDTSLIINKYKEYLLRFLSLIKESADLLSHLIFRNEFSMEDHVLILIGFQHSSRRMKNIRCNRYLS